MCVCVREIEREREREKEREGERALSLVVILLNCVIVVSIVEPNTLRKRVNFFLSSLVK